MRVVERTWRCGQCGERMRQPVTVDSVSHRCPKDNMKRHWLRPVGKGGRP